MTVDFSGHSVLSTLSTVNCDIHFLKTIHSWNMTLCGVYAGKHMQINGIALLPKPAKPKVMATNIFSRFMCRYTCAKSYEASRDLQVLFVVIRYSRYQTLWNQKWVSIGL